MFIQLKICLCSAHFSKKNPLAHNPGHDHCHDRADDRSGHAHPLRTIALILIIAGAPDTADIATAQVVGAGEELGVDGAVLVALIIGRVGEIVQPEAVGVVGGVARDLVGDASRGGVLPVGGAPVDGDEAAVAL